MRNHWKHHYYTCDNCKEEWLFFPSDYRYKKSSYPTRCALCSMPIVQVFKDIYQNVGLWEAIKFILQNRLKIK